MIHRPCLNFVLRCSFGLIGNYQTLNELLESNPFAYLSKKGSAPVGFDLFCRLRPVALPLTPVAA